MSIKTSKRLLVFSYNIVGDKMNKSLPKVFENKIVKKASNNKTVYYGEDTKQVEKKAYEDSIEMKISKLFKSPKYIYKIDVEMTTKTGKKNCKIIGKNKQNLITIENELIPIDSILDIKEL